MTTLPVMTHLNTKGYPAAWADPGPGLLTCPAVRCSPPSREAALWSALRTRTFQLKPPPIRYPRSVVTSGMPCAARRRPSFSGALGLGQLHAGECDEQQLDLVPAGPDEICRRHDIPRRGNGCRCS